MKDGYNRSINKAEQRIAKMEERRMQNEIMQMGCAVNDANQSGRGIVEYDTVYLEGLVQEPPNSVSTVISGGTDDMRVNNAAVFIWEAQQQGLPVVVLHNHDVHLEHAISSFFSNSCIINPSNPIYDPIYGMNSSQIADAILYSAPNDSLKDDVLYLISGIEDYLKAKNTVMTSSVLGSAPVIDLYDKVMQAVSNGVISQNTAQPILNKLIQGQNSTASFASYLNRFKLYGKGLIRLSSQHNHLANINTTMQSKAIISLNLGAAPNPIVQNLIIFELLQIIASGRRFLLVLDGIHIGMNENLKQLALSGFSGVPFAWLGKDIYGLLGGNDDAFYSVVGTAQRCLFYRQPNAVTATKCADIIGKYEHLSLDRSYGSGNSGFTRNISVGRNQQYRVDPQDLLNQTDLSGYYFNAETSEVIYSDYYMLSNGT